MSCPILLLIVCCAQLQLYSDTNSYVFFQYQILAIILSYRNTLFVLALPHNLFCRKCCTYVFYRVSIGIRYTMVLTKLVFSYIFTTNPGVNVPIERNH